MSMNKLGIVIIVYNIPSDIFLLQLEAIRAFCKDEDYVIEIVDNSSDLAKGRDLRYHAEEQGVNYYKTYSSSQDSSDSHTWAANFAYQRLKNRYEYMLFLDHDLFPVKPFSVEILLNGGHVMAGLGQGAKKKYMWAGLVMLANSRIDTSEVDFSTNGEFQLDTGGNLYKIIEKYGEENCVFFNESYHQNPYFNGPQYAHYAMINNEMFLHFVNASNWNRANRNTERLASLINIVKEYLDAEKNLNIHKDKH